MIKIKDKGKYTYISDGKRTVKTGTINAGLPVFRINNDLVEIYPILKLKIREHILSNHLKFNVSKYIDSDCWLSTNGKSSNGYGTIYISFLDLGFRIAGDAHIASQLAFNGPINEGFIVTHKCDNKPCCNPDHLDAATYHDNMMDASTRRDYCPPLNRAWKVNTKMVCLIRFLYKERILGVTHLAIIFEMTKDNIRKIVDYTTYPNVDCSWFYEKQMKRRRRWTPEQIEAMLETGFTAERLGILFECSPGSITPLLAEARRNKNIIVRRRFTPEEDELVIESGKKHGQTKKLADKLGVHVKTIYDRRCYLKRRNSYV